MSVIQGLLEHTVHHVVGAYSRPKPISLGSPYERIHHRHFGTQRHDHTLRPERTQGFAADPFHGRARCSPMSGALKTARTVRRGSVYFYETDGELFDPKTIN